MSASRGNESRTAVSLFDNITTPIWRSILGFGFPPSLGRFKGQRGWIGTFIELPLQIFGCRQFQFRLDKPRSMLKNLYLCFSICIGCRWISKVTVGWKAAVGPINLAIPYGPSLKQNLNRQEITLLNYRWLAQWNDFQVVADRLLKHIIRCLTRLNQGLGIFFSFFLLNC